MYLHVYIIFLIHIFLQIVNAQNDIKENEIFKNNAIKIKDYVYWPNGTIPFYIEENHFDADQKTEIQMALFQIVQKTCLKFLPVLTAPTEHQHVLVFENPGGVKKCVLNTAGHPRDAPHKVILGYNCLKSPHIDMAIMKALGFGFEHNRASRDLFVDVQLENIDMAFMDLFTKDNKLPSELQALPYDVNSVLHFGERDYSKNGHRTIIFKDHRTKQNRAGLSPLDLRKIEIVYGPECRRRNRQEQIELCQTYPGIARKKREVEQPEHKSLRVNPNITPPPEDLNVNAEGENKTETNVNFVLNELGITNEVQEVVDQVHKVTSLALKNARLKYCNNSKPGLRETADLETKNTNDLLGVVEMVASFAKSVVDNAVTNLTAFCMESDTIEAYQRARCGYGSGSDRCPVYYKSTKSGRVQYSTQHRPIIIQSTWHHGRDKIFHYGHHRARDDSAEAVTDAEKNGDVSTSTTKELRRKREVNSEAFRNKRDVQSGDTETNANLTTVEDTTTTVDSSNRDLKMEKTDRNDARRFKERRYSVKHRQSAERIWDNSNLSIKDMFADDKKEKRERNKEDLGEITKANNDVDIRHTENDNSRENRERPESRQVKKHKNRWVEKDREEGNLYDNKPKILKEPSKDDNEESLKENDKSRENRERPESGQVKKHRNRWVEKDREGNLYDNRPKILKEPNKDDKEESLEDKSEVKKNIKRPEREYKIDNLEEKKRIKKYRQRPDRDNREGRLEEKGEVKKYKERPNRQKSHPQRPRRPPPASSQETRSSRPKTVPLSKLNKEFYDERRWPEGVVPYYIKEDPNYDTEDIRQRLEEVNRILKQRTCVRLQELKEKQLPRYEDYMILDTSADFVTGRVGGKQNFGCLELFRGGQHRQHAAMVVMAMLGFYFELARHDRDEYVRVHLRHVRPDKLHHFEKIRDDATLPLPYDYKSATHPAWQFWRKLGKSGISTVATYKHLDPDGAIMKSLGQNDQLLSELDIVKINSVYGVQCFERQKTNDMNEYKKSRRRG